MVDHQGQVKVRRLADGTLSVGHGPCEVAAYDSGNERLADGLPTAAQEGRKEFLHHGADAQALPARPRGQTGQFICSRTGHSHLLTKLSNKNNDKGEIY